MPASRVIALVVAAILLNVAWHEAASADDPAEPGARPKRVLLLGQRADSHPRSTHEYMAAMRIIARLLQDRGNIQVVVIQADSPWTDGPELLDGADGAVVFLTEGAKWVCDDAKRLAAFQRLVKRGGGLSCLHWGSGTKEAAPVADFVALFGGCHGGPDRKYQVGDFQLVPSSKPHPVTSGISPFEVHDELYYDLKYPVSREGHAELMETQIAGVAHSVAWAWEKPGAGRSFGFTGLHFHENWKRSEYRRLLLQGILWTMNEPIPANGLDVKMADKDFALPDAVVPE